MIAPGYRIAPFALPAYGGGTGAWQPGRVTAFSFCALWCDTWREQSARIARTKAALAGLPVDFVAVSVDGRWAERYAGGTVLLDAGGRLSWSLDVSAVPLTLLVDRSGVVRLARQGIVRSEELIETARSLATGGASGANAGAIFLTFADFPSVVPGDLVSPDEELLDILRREGVRATFLGVAARLATPAGAACARRARREGHTLREHLPAVVINPYDLDRPGESELLRRVLYAARPRAVVLLHAGVAQTCDALPALIASLRQRGFDLDRLP